MNFRLGVPHFVELLVLLREHVDAQLPLIEVRIGDPRVDWEALESCEAGLPAIDQGQVRDCRWSQEDGSSLHAHIHEDVVRFHLDRYDPAVSPIRHLATETNTAPGAVAGGVLGGMLGGPLGLALGAILGGAASGIGIRPRITSVWTLDELYDLDVRTE